MVGKEFNDGAVAFFELQPGLRLALWPRRNLARDAGLPRSAPGPTEFSLGHNVSSRTEVDAVMAQAKAARRLAELLGVPWDERGAGPFSPVYVNEVLTLDFQDAAA